MVYFMLVCSGLLLLGANWSMRKKDVESAVTTCVIWIVLSFLLTFLSVQFKFAVALMVLCFFAARFAWIQKHFMSVSLSLMGMVYSGQYLSDYLHTLTLRTEFPLVDLTTRLPQRPVLNEKPVLSPRSESRLNELEVSLHKLGENSWMGERRARLSKELHEHAVTQFGGNPGFGAMRMPMVVGRWSFNYLMREEEVPDQPAEVRPTEPSPSQWTIRYTEAAGDKLDVMHDVGQFEFMNPARYGYIKGNKQVAGFLSHQFNKQPSADITLQRIDLISLELHDEPVAYETKKLPKMKELRQNPTRPLELFESVALKALRNGEDLVINETEDTVWMVGALRATKQCLSCHDVPRGELLGAFSYVLKRPTMDAASTGPK